jgi:hypothetical protein
MNVSGSIKVTGSITIAGGSLNVSGPINASGLITATGGITSAGTITQYGAINISGSLAISGPSSSSFVNTSVGSSYGTSQQPTLTVGSSNNPGCILLNGAAYNSLIQASNYNLHVDTLVNATGYGIYLNYYTPDSDVYVFPASNGGSFVVGATTHNSTYKTHLLNSGKAGALQVDGDSLLRGTMNITGAMNILVQYL